MLIAEVKNVDAHMHQVVTMEAAKRIVAANPKCVIGRIWDKHPITGFEKLVGYGDQNISVHI